MHVCIFNEHLFYGKQDSQDPNPLIRALAVRTMGCIRVDKITEYLCDPLQRCLKVEYLGLLLFLYSCLVEFVLNFKILPLNHCFFILTCNFPPFFSPFIILYFYFDRTTIHMYARQQPYVLLNFLT